MLWTFKQRVLRISQSCKSACRKNTAIYNNIGQYRHNGFKTEVAKGFLNNI